MTTTTQPPQTITTKGFCGLLTVPEVEATLGPVDRSEESPVGCRWGTFPQDVGLVLIPYNSPADAAVEFKSQLLSPSKGATQADDSETIGERTYFFTHYGRDGHVVWLQGSYVCHLWLDRTDHTTGNRPAALSLARLAVPRIH